MRKLMVVGLAALALVAGCASVEKEALKRGELVERTFDKEGKMLSEKVTRSSETVKLEAVKELSKGRKLVEIDCSGVQDCLKGRLTVWEPGAEGGGGQVVAALLREPVSDYQATLHFLGGVIDRATPWIAGGYVLGKAFDRGPTQTLTVNGDGSAGAIGGSASGMGAYSGQNSGNSGRIGGRDSSTSSTETNTTTDSWNRIINCNPGITGGAGAAAGAASASFDCARAP